MQVAQTPGEIAPEIELRQAGADRTEARGMWNICLVLTNRGGDGIELVSARLPHGQFRADEHIFDAATRIAAGECFTFEARVRCLEPHGPVTENAFVILLVKWREARWRIFFRLRVVVDPAGTPRASTESVTTQKVGFSEVKD